LKKWNVIVKGKGTYGWTADMFTIQRKHTVHGAVSAGLREFLDHGDKPIPSNEFQELRITCQLREEKAA